MAMAPKKTTTKKTDVKKLFVSEVEYNDLVVKAMEWCEFSPIYQTPDGYELTSECRCILDTLVELRSGVFRPSFVPPSAA